MGIQVTERAANRIKGFMQQHPQGVGLRVGIRKTGCSGYSYTVDFADAISDADQAFDDAGVRIVVNKDHLPVFDGCTIDYVREGLNEKFAFLNPNAGATCGCGESFTLGSDESAADASVLNTGRNLTP